MAESVQKEREGRPWLATIALRHGTGARQGGWMWGARLTGPARDAFALWLLELNVETASGWLKGDALAEQRAIWRSRAKKAPKAQSFAEAFGWGSGMGLHAMAGAMGREMGGGSASVHAVVEGGGCGPNGEIEIAFYASAARSADPQVAWLMARKAMLPMARRLAQAGPAAKASTFWMPALAPIEGALKTELAAATFAREEIRAGAGLAAPSAQGPDAPAASEGGRGARRL
jgi:hypothetical protein